MYCRELQKGSDRGCFYSIPIHSVILDLVSFEVASCNAENLLAEVAFCCELSSPI